MENSAQDDSNFAIRERSDCHGKDWKRISDLIPPMKDVVQPLLNAAAEKYLEDKPDWQTQNCG